MMFNAHNAYNEHILDLQREAENARLAKQAGYSPFAFLKPMLCRFGKALIFLGGLLERIGEKPALQQ